MPGNMCFFTKYEKNINVCIHIHTIVLFSQETELHLHPTSNNQCCLAYVKQTTVVELIRSTDRSHIRN